MTHYANIARPYALAAFEYARDKQQLPAWKGFLASAALTAKDPAVAKLLANPEIEASRLFDLFQGVLASILDAEQKNFLLLLAQNRRLLALPAIADVFDAYYAALEKTSNVRVITAIDIQEDYKQTLTRALSKRIERDVILHCETDPAILGGAIIHIGDNVIDGSVRGKLNRLREDLMTG
jgi:F-type H+-transporting ATPase subunit delta